MATAEPRTAPAAPSAPLVPRLRRVVARRPETADTVTLTLAPVDPQGGERRADEPEAAEATPRPGQFAMLAALGTGEVPISYSSVDGPGGLVEHTVRSAGAATAALVAARPGDLLASRGPYGTGWDLGAAEGRDVVVVAGGIGLAPLTGLVEAVLAERDRHGSVNLLVGVRTPEDLCFADRLREWSARGDVEVAITVDRLGDPAHRWPGAIGVVTTLLDGACFDPSTARAFVCGPEVMMRATVRALAERGVDLADVEVSVERSMTCGVGLCGHCQLGPVLTCREGPVLPASRVLPLLEVRER